MSETLPTLSPLPKDDKRKKRVKKEKVIPEFKIVWATPENPIIVTFK
jgi:hypothetical protein